MINKDTISALATPTGGAIAVIRLSGPEAIAITDKIFHSASGRPLSEAEANTLHYGEIISSSDFNNNLSSENGDGKASSDSKEDTPITIDDVVVSVYRAPHSYTGEDCVEISCHGSAYIVQQILMALENNGSRQAEPGEYTRRAYLNGKMDLTQAEAVADLIASTSRAQHQMAISQLKGQVSSKLGELRKKLLKLTSLLELELDFSDHEELEFANRNELNNLAHEIDSHILHLAESFKTGNAMKNGIPVAIVGKTNVGKSTLLNALLHEERAIVSSIHGTTRDIIEDTTTINGVLFRFIDTAGLRKTDDTIERIGIDRALSAIGRSLVVLWVIDEEPSEEDIKAIKDKCENKHLIIILNKADIHKDLTRVPLIGSLKSAFPATPIVEISAKNGDGIKELEQTVYNSLSLAETNSSDVVISNARHYTILMKAHSHLSSVIDKISLDIPADLLAEDLKLVIDDLASITGQDRIESQETLNFIFKNFCVGK